MKDIDYVLYILYYIHMATHLNLLTIKIDFDKE